MLAILVSEMRVSKRHGEMFSGEAMASAGGDGGGEKAFGFPVT